MVIAVCILVFSFFNYFGRIFRIEWTKVDEGVLNATVEHDLEWESWTPFSRITVADIAHNIGFGWGISDKMMSQFPEYKVEQKNLTIDSAAATVITRNTMQISKLLHLHYDSTNFAHYLFPNSKVGIIGVGGGRDILSALHFNQKEIWGIEINGRIIDALTKVYAGYTYNISALPNVHIIEDEARNFFEKNDMKFDIIQASLIDSWAASAVPLISPHTHIMRLKNLGMALRQRVFISFQYSFIVLIPLLLPFDVDAHVGDGEQVTQSLHVAGETTEVGGHLTHLLDDLHLHVRHVHLHVGQRLVDLVLFLRVRVEPFLHGLDGLQQVLDGFLQHGHACLQ